MSDSILEAIESTEGIVDVVDQEIEIQDNSPINWDGLFWSIDRSDLLFLFQAISKIPTMQELYLGFKLSGEYLKIYTGSEDYYLERDFKLKNTTNVFVPDQTFYLRFLDVYVLVRVYTNFVFGFKNDNLYFYNNWVNIQFDRYKGKDMQVLKMPIETTAITFDKKLFSFLRAMIENSVRMMDHKIFFGKDTIKGFHYHYCFNVKGISDILSDIWIRRYDVILLLSLFSDGGRSFYSVKNDRVYIKFPMGFVSWIQLKQQTENVKTLWEEDKGVFFDINIPMLRRALVVLFTFGMSMLKLVRGKSQVLVIKSGEQGRYNFIVGKITDADTKVDIDMSIDIFKKIIEIILAMTDKITVRMEEGGLSLSWIYNKMEFNLQLASQVAIVIQ
jgi:hypothetical protein